MSDEKKDVKVQDLSPRKDAKGGVAKNLNSLNPNAVNPNAINQDSLNQNSLNQDSLQNNSKNLD
jgi:hypothetical protein